MKACNRLVGKPVVSEWHRVCEVAQLVVSVPEASCHWTTTLQHSPGTGQSSCLHPFSLWLPRHKQSFNRTRIQIRFLCCWLIKYSVINKSSLDGGGDELFASRSSPGTMKCRASVLVPRRRFEWFFKTLLKFCITIMSALLCQLFLTDFFHTLVNLPFWNKFNRCVGQNNQKAITSLLREISFPKFVFSGHKV